MYLGNRKGTENRGRSAVAQQAGQWIGMGWHRIMWVQGPGLGSKISREAIERRESRRVGVCGGEGEQERAKK